MPYCKNCGGSHYTLDCTKEVLSTKAVPLSTSAKVLSTPLSTVKEVIEQKKVSMTQYERLKKWRQSHREEYNAQMRKKRSEV